MRYATGAELIARRLESVLSMVDLGGAKRTEKKALEPLMIPIPPVDLLDVETLLIRFLRRILSKITTLTVGEPQLPNQVYQLYLATSAIRIIADGFDKWN